MCDLSVQQGVQPIDPQSWKHTRKHVMGVSVSTRMCACVSVAVGRLPAQEGEWAAASAQAAGGPLPETPSRPWIPARVSSPGREKGAQLPQTTWGWGRWSEARPFRASADSISLLCRYSAVRTKMVSFPHRLSPE